MAAILFVDDEPNIREALAREFELEGYQAFAAGDPAEALRVLALRDVDLVVTDIHMPGNVHGFLSWLKASRPRLPVEVYSGDLGPLPGEYRGRQLPFAG